MASCGLKVWCIKQSRGIQGYTGIYTSIAGQPAHLTSVQLDSRNSSTRRRGVSGRLAHPHQVRRRPECPRAHPHFLGRLGCFRPLLLSFPFSLMSSTGLAIVTSMFPIYPGISCSTLVDLAILVDPACLAYSLFMRRLSASR